MTKCRVDNVIEKFPVRYYEILVYAPDEKSVIFNSSWCNIRIGCRNAFILSMVRVLNNFWTDDDCE